MERNERISFLKMLEEVLLKRVNDIKHLGQKSNYSLEKWEELFGYICTLTSVEEKSDNSSVQPSLIANILGILNGVDTLTAIVLFQGINENGQHLNFMSIKGNKADEMTLIAYLMDHDQDFEQIILGGLYAFNKIRGNREEKEK